MTHDPRMAELEARVQEMEAHAAQLRAQVAEAQRLLTQTTAERDRFQELYRRALEGARARGKGAELPSVEEVMARREMLALHDKAQIVERALERVRQAQPDQDAPTTYTQASLL